MQCAFKVGFFIVRQCGRSARTLCSKCNTILCEAHQSVADKSAGARAPILCLRCATPEQSSRSDYDNRSTSHSSSSSSSSSNTVSGGGGQFGGGGASSRWSSESPASAGNVSSPALLGGLPIASSLTDSDQMTTDKAGFDAKDVALFDEVSKFDETAHDSTSYDS